MTRDELVARLIRAGELEVSGEDQTETDSYFDGSKYRLHGPDGFETDYAGSLTISSRYGRLSMIVQFDEA